MMMLLLPYVFLHRKELFMKKNVTIPFVLALTVGLIFSVVCVLLPNMSGTMINKVLEEPDRASIYILSFALLGILKFVLHAMDRIFFDLYNMKQKKHMRDVAYLSITKKVAISQEEKAGITSFINNDIPAVVEQYYAGTIDIAKCCCILALAVLSLFRIHWMMAAIIVTASGLIVFIPGALKESSGKSRMAYAEALGKYNSKLLSFLDGVTVVKLYGYREKSAKILEENNQTAYSKELGTTKYRWFISQISALAQIARVVVTLIVGVWLVLKGTIQIGDLVAVISLGSLIAAPAEVLSYLIHARNEVRPLNKRYEEMLQQVVQENANHEDIYVESIAIDGLSYSTSETQILQDVSMSFDKGKKYMITGESGSGKSTLLKLLSGIADCDYVGHIRINGKELKEIPIETRSHFMAMCPQEPYLFYESLKENICLGREISDAQYQTILKKLNLGYLLERFGNQEITPEITEKLSGGEKQRITIARAMLSKPQIYLLDEVTSALDAQNSYEIEKLLLTEDAMVINVCHKKNEALMPMYDGIYTLD